MNNKVEHLKMIQGVINRMAQNSFLLKGWNVVIVSALFAFAAKGSQLSFAYIAFLPAVIFWGLDGYFLQQERLFRRLYDHVRALCEEEVDFSMNTEKVKDNVASWLDVTLSKTLLLFHSAIFGSIVLVIVISSFILKKGCF